jgi:hypothetical protein
MKTCLLTWQCLVCFILFAGKAGAEAKPGFAIMPFVQVETPGNISLTKLLSELENKYKVSFLYKADVLKSKVVPSTLLETQDLSAILSELTSITGLTFEQTGKTVYTILQKKAGTESQGSGQNNTESLPDTIGQQANVQVHGIISDEGSKPIPGAAVMIVGTQKGVISGLDGSFSISCPMNSTIRFRYVGYQRYEGFFTG